MSTKKLTTESFVARAKMLHGGKYTYPRTSYVTSRLPVVVTCAVHGDFTTTPRDHIHSASGCPRCAGFAAPWSEIATRLMDIHGSKFNYIPETYTNISSPMSAVCTIHGEFTTTPKLLLRGHGCQTCAPTRKLSFEEYVDKATAVHGGRYSYAPTSERQNGKTCVVVICVNHGAFTQDRSVHLRGHGCPKCAKARSAKALRSTDSHLHALVQPKTAVGFTVDTASYTNRKSKLEVQCPRGHKYSQAAGDIPRFGCPVCSHKVSKPEQELADFIEQFTPVRRSDRTIIAPQELDMVVPSRRVAVEFNGLYYHSTGHLELATAKVYHQSKTQACARAGYQLLHVWESDWLLYRSRVEHAIRYALGVLPRTGARSCSIQQVPTKAAAEFLNTYHLQGAVAAKCHLGLYDEAVLVAIMSFGPTSSVRGNRDASLWELKRFASSRAVAGGAQRLFRHFIGAYPEVHRVISYADLSWFTGALYLKLGFAETHVVPPDYKIYQAGTTSGLQHKTTTKKSCLKSLLGARFDPAKTEYELTQANRLYRVYDCGKIRYDWARDQ